MTRMERRHTNSKLWPRTFERRASSVPQRARRWLLMNSINIAMLLLLAGLVGLVVGTGYGSRPTWPAPIVFYATSTGAAIACILSLLRPTKQTRLAGILGVLATAVMRGTSYLIQGTDTGLRIGAAVGAYLLVAGLAIIAIAQAFGESLGGGHGRWGS